MRKLALLLMLVLFSPACRSSKAPVPEWEEEPKRDYRSINRTSIAFMKEAMRSARRERKERWQELRESRSYRRARNKRQRKLGRKFAANSFTQGERQGTREMWQALKREFTWPKDLRKNARFGFLDSGE